MANTNARYDNTVIGGPHKVTEETDIPVLQLLNVFPYLPSKYIGALLNMPGMYYQDVLKKLRTRAGLIYVPETSWFAKSDHQQAVYALRKKGKDYLKDKGLFVPMPRMKESELKHELGVCLIRASFILGARQHGLTYGGPADILAHSKCPPSTRKETAPWTFDISFQWQSLKTKKTRPITQSFRTDGEFFTLKASDGSVLAFPGFEFDRHTEPLESDDPVRASIRKKFLGYRAAVSKGLYEKRYGFPERSTIIPFITISELHMHSMMEILREITSDHGSEIFIFKNIPNFAAFESFPPADGHILSGDWYRVGHGRIERYNILNDLKGGESGGGKAPTHKAAHHATRRN